MSTDRELLEFAAKACGYNTNNKWNRERLEMNPPVIGLVVHDGNDDLVSTGWNPLDSDGDALRLAVKLKIDITFFEGYQQVLASSHCCEHEVFIDYSDDRGEDVRFAIVRAAAEIGRVMP